MLHPGSPICVSVLDFGLLIAPRDSGGLVVEVYQIGEQDLPRYRVLLVDDDQHIHEMMELLIRQTEYSLSSATNAHDAIEMIDRDPPDILITDAMMPGESGFNLIEKIKSILAGETFR